MQLVEVPVEAERLDRDVPAAFELRHRRQRVPLRPAEHDRRASSPTRLIAPLRDQRADRAPRDQRADRAPRDQRADRAVRDLAVRQAQTLLHARDAERQSQFDRDRLDVPDHVRQQQRFLGWHAPNPPCTSTDEQTHRRRSPRRAAKRHA